MSSSEPPPAPPPLPKVVKSQIEREEKNDKENLIKAFQSVYRLDYNELGRLLSDNRVGEWLERPADQSIVDEVNSIITVGNNMDKGERLRSKFTLEEGLNLGDYIKKREKADIVRGQAVNIEAHESLSAAHKKVYKRLGIWAYKVPSSMANLFEPQSPPSVRDNDANPSRISPDESVRSQSPGIKLPGASPDVLLAAQNAAQDVRASQNNSSGVQADSTPSVKTVPPTTKQERNRNN